MYIPKRSRYLMGGGGGGGGGGGRKSTAKRKYEAGTSAGTGDAGGSGGIGGVGGVGGPGSSGGNDGGSKGGEEDDIDEGEAGGESGVESNVDTGEVGGENGGEQGGDNGGGEEGGVNGDDEDDNDDENDEEDDEDDDEKGKDDDDDIPEVGMVVISTRLIPYHAILSEQDVRMVLYLKKAITRSVITDTKQAVGKMAVVQIPKNTILKTSMLRPVYWYVTAARMIPARQIIGLGDVRLAAFPRSSPNRFENITQVIGSRAAQTIYPNTPITRSLLDGI